MLVQTSVAYRGLALTPVKLPGVPGGARLSVREIQIDGRRVWVSNTDMPLYPPTASLSLSRTCPIFSSVWRHSQAAASVASVAQEATQAAQEAAAEVQDVVETAKAAQQATLDALYELEALPGAKGFHSQEVQAAIEQVKSEMEGRSYSYMGKSSYEEAMKEIDRMEKTGKSVVECLSQEGC